MFTKAPATRPAKESQTTTLEWKILRIKNFKVVNELMFFPTVIFSLKCKYICVKTFFDMTVSLGRTEEMYAEFKWYGSSGLKNQTKIKHIYKKIIMHSISCHLIHKHTQIHMDIHPKYLASNISNL